jgi:hypothetical protein
MPGPDDRSLRSILPMEKGPSTASSTRDWRSIGSRYGTGTPDATRIPLDQLEQMRKDPMLQFALVFIKSALARAPWRIVGNDPRRNAFVQKSLERIYDRLIIQAAGALDYGYSPVVKRFERSDAPKDWRYVDEDGELRPVWTATAQPLIWRPFLSLNPHKARAHFDSSGSFDGIEYATAKGDGRFPWEPGDKSPSIPLQWAFWFTSELDNAHGSIYGYPRTGYAARYWWASWYRFSLADRAFERWADPPVVAHHPTDTAVDPATGETRNMTQEALGLAERLRSGANVSLPSDGVTSLDGDKVTAMRKWSLEQMKSEVDFTAMNESFETLEVAKLRAMMVPEQAFLEGRGGTSSRNVASELGDAFEKSLGVVKAEIDDHINRFLIPQLLEVNFGRGGSTCEIKTTGFDPQDIDTGRAIVQAFAQNDPQSLKDIDFRRLLEQLGVPLKPEGQAQAEPVGEIEETELTEEVADKPKRKITQLLRREGKIVGLTETEVDAPVEVEFTEKDLDTSERRRGLLERLWSRSR